MKEIKLTQGKFALVDDKDYEYINQYKWFAQKIGYTFYAARREGSKYIYMHRFLLNIDDRRIDVDHRDRNGLNNTRNNIRLATRSQNNANGKKRKNCTSEFRGVSWNKMVKKWAVRIQHDKKQLYLEYFKDENEAGRHYNIKALEIFGEFANLNKIA